MYIFVCVFVTLFIDFRNSFRITKSICHRSNHSNSTSNYGAV